LKRYLDSKVDSWRSGLNEPSHIEFMTALKNELIKIMKREKITNGKGLFYHAKRKLWVNPNRKYIDEVQMKRFLKNVGITRIEFKGEKINGDIKTVVIDDLDKIIDMLAFCLDNPFYTRKSRKKIPLP
jgi:hypothetical protein